MIRNTHDRYGWPTKVLHWLMAVGVFGLFGLGLYMVELDYYHSWYRGSMDLHKSVGLVMAALLLLRLLWRGLNPQPRPLPGPAWQLWLAGAIHTLLYLGLAGLMLSGYFISTADGRAIEVFGLFGLPALPWALEQQEELAGQVHEILAWLLIALVALHAAAALKHHFIDRDSTLKRML